MASILDFALSAPPTRSRGHSSSSAKVASGKSGWSLFGSSKPSFHQVAIKRKHTWIFISGEVLNEIKDQKPPLYFNIKNPNNQTTIDRIRDEVYTLQYRLNKDRYLEPYVESWLKDYPWREGSTFAGRLANIGTKWGREKLKVLSEYGGDVSVWGSALNLYSKMRSLLEQRKERNEKTSFGRVKVPLKEHERSLEEIDEAFNETVEKFMEKTGGEWVGKKVDTELWRDPNWGNWGGGGRKKSRKKSRKSRRKSRRGKKKSSRKKRRTKRRK